MPTFFDPTSLTDVQKSRWDAAIVEYSRVQEENLEQRFANLSEADRAYYLRKGMKTDEEIKASMRQLGALMWNSPCHPKSALFFRLLEGIAPLPFPPPTNYSYPWYSVVEVPGSHRVVLGDCVTAGGHMRGTGGANGDFSIEINQCMWTVKGMNAAAKKLLDLDRQLSKSAIEDEEGEISKIYVWSDALLGDVKAAYAAGPELVVQYGEWPEFRLFVGQKNGEVDCHKSQRRYAEKQIQGRPTFLKSVGSVFDLDQLYLNARVGKTLGFSVHPKKRLEDATTRYAHLVSINEHNTLAASLDKHSIDQQFKQLETDVVEYESNPDGWDWVELLMDQWLLEKVIHF